MKMSKGHAGTIPLAFAIAVCAASVSWAAASSTSGANEHVPPADVAHKEARQAVANRPIMRAENADYEHAVKACKKLPLSERTTCISEAGNSAKLAAGARREASGGK